MALGPLVELVTQGVADQIGRGLGLHLVQEVRLVRAGGLDAEAELARDIRHLAAKHEAIKHLAFARRQAGVRQRFAGRARLTDEALRGCRADEHLTLDDLADRENQLLQCAVLGDISGSARLQRFDDILILLMHAEHDHAPVLVRSDLAQQRDSTAPGHGEIQQDDVAGQLTNSGQKLISVGRLANNFEIRLIREHLLQPFAEDRMVVGYKQPNHGAAAAASLAIDSGSRTEMRVPRPGALSISIDPPSICARSLMPTRPKCSRLDRATSIPRPSSLISSCSPSWEWHATMRADVAPLCRTMFVN